MEHFIAFMTYDGTSDPPGIIGVYVGENALQDAKDACQLDSMRYEHDTLPENIPEEDLLEWEANTDLHLGLEEDIVEWQAQFGSMGPYIIQPVLIHGLPE